MDVIAVALAIVAIYVSLVGTLGYFVILIFRWAFPWEPPNRTLVNIVRSDLRFLWALLHRIW